MRKFLCSLIALPLVALILPSHASYALTVGAPVRTLEEGGFSLAGSIGYTTLDIRGEDVTSKAFFLKGALPAGSGIMPYVKLGFADLEAGSVHGSLDFAYGGGVLLDIVTQESGNGFRASFDAQIQWSESSESGTSLSAVESQLSFIGSVRSSGTNAYAGLSSSFISFDNGSSSEDENGQGHLVFGMDYFMDYNFYFNAEAHLFGQDSLSVGVGYEF